MFVNIFSLYAKEDFHMEERRQMVSVVTESYKNRRTMRRKSVIRKKGIYFVAALLTIILVLIFNTANIANAGIRETERYKYFTSIEVEAGTSLWDIAEEYMTEEYRSPKDYIQEVKNINHMKSDLIYEGSYLCIPYYSAEKK